MEKYIVIRQQGNGNGDVYKYLHGTLEAANTDADMRWERLTDRERDEDEILVVAVSENDLDATLADEESDGWDGEHDWFAYTGYRVIRNLEKQMWMEIMVHDWLTDHHDEMEELVVDWDYFDPDEMSVVAEDDRYTYSLYAIDGDIYIAYLGTK